MNSTDLQTYMRPATTAGLALSLLAFGAFAGSLDGRATAIAGTPKPATSVQDNLDSSRLEAKLFLHRPGFVATAGATR